MPLTTFKHALFSEILGCLRDKSTSSQNFAQLSGRAASILAVEATRDLPLEKYNVSTPLTVCESEKLKSEIVLVPILRAGLGFVSAFTLLLPNAAIGHIGLKRNEETAEASGYYLSLPNLTNKEVIVLDPMLATGGSAVAALDQLTEKGAKSIRYVSLIAAPEGIARVKNKYPFVSLFIGVIDKELDSRSFIVPGLGDYGDRLFGTD